MKHKPPENRAVRTPQVNVSSNLGSMLNARSKAVNRGGVVSKPAGPSQPLPIRQFLPEHSTDSTIKAPAPKVAGALVHPAHCCVYCGHLVYTPPRAVTIRCPMCAHELPVEDILLSGTVTDPEVITCGKIVVVENTLVRGNLIACTIDVAGSVCGDIVASHLCTLRPTARHVGRLLSRNLNLQEGAVVESYIELIRD